MKRLLLLAFCVAAIVAPGAAAAAPRVLVIHFGPDLAINPVTQDWLDAQLDRAEHGYAAAVIELDTPGGLSTSMKAIYERELATTVPVIVYVAPSGARAASAGVWVSEAADVLAMSPVSNIGSSTPIDSSGQNLASDERRKTMNDAAAGLQALAAAHGRNTRWPVLAVTKASNLTAHEALAQGVIDAVAPTLPALLRKLDGYHTKDRERPFTLHLAGATLVDSGPGFLTRLLNTVVDPNLISILFLGGLIGLAFEVLHPGLVLPGALGAVALVLALYGFSVLEPSWGGVALVVLGVALLAVDLHAMTHGALTVAGLVALGFGLALLFQDQPPAYRVNLGLVIGIGAAVSAFWLLVAWKGVAARRLPVAAGPELLVGSTGVVRADGHVLVRGELWRARSEDGSPLPPGRQVAVSAVDGLELTVRDLGNEPLVTYHSQ